MTVAAHDHVDAVDAAGQGQIIFQADVGDGDDDPAAPGFEFPDGLLSGLPAVQELRGLAGIAGAHGLVVGNAEDADLDALELAHGPGLDGRGGKRTAFVRLEVAGQHPVGKLRQEARQRRAALVEFVVAQGGEVVGHALLQGGYQGRLAGREEDGALHLIAGV